MRTAITFYKFRFVFFYCVKNSIFQFFFWLCFYFSDARMIVKIFLWKIWHIQLFSFSLLLQKHLSYFIACFKHNICFTAEIETLYSMQNCKYFILQRATRKDRFDIIQKFTNLLINEFILLIFYDYFCISWIKWKKSVHATLKHSTDIEKRTDAIYNKQIKNVNKGMKNENLLTPRIELPSFQLSIERTSNIAF